MGKTLNRRDTLRVLAATPWLAVLPACSKSEPDSCSDVSSLTDGEKTARATLQYTDRSMQKDKRCDLCNYYKPDANVAVCGSCQLVKGPIHPKGYCTAFAAKT